MYLSNKTTGPIDQLDVQVITYEKQQPDPQGLREWFLKTNLSQVMNNTS